MSEVVNINNQYFDYLEPLQRWRILDLNSLREELPIKPGYHNFAKLLRRLEKMNFIGAYIDPFTKKKFVYLSPKGEKHLSTESNPIGIVNETLVHDIKVTEITKELLAKNLIEKVELEHQVNDKRNFKTTYKIIPDAILHFNKNNFSYRVALELELTRKSNPRIIEKVKQYRNSEYYHYLMYMFPNTKLMEKYKEVIMEELGTESLNRIMFFAHENLTWNVSEIENLNGYLGNTKKLLFEVFK